ncbi:biliverdin-producing heme oxygenase [Catalinimonas niigatensis]|uniref:biliverdin-producing heme oxygenase n=1 Tax=Catalinimonas niigatensis TaxID=1397264 RepID=UPI00266717C2|nr:biliverdin-producing heme oxygenase [Catalinimonas niigatensis]WPP50062.1 biliverdin-producing heme oxygenase [Catalinimonas niigatensis]
MILQDLRAKTFEQHHQLESHPLLHQLTSTDLSLSVYATILHKFYGYFSPLEALVNQFSLESYLPDFAERRKTQLLLQDLEKLDLEISIQLCDNLPAIYNMESAMGAMYVMEGSTLGGQMISRQVEKALGLTPARGTAFFYGYGKETGKRWKRFQEGLQRLALTRDDCQTLITTSQNTFFKFNHWLSV